ncbi:MAG: hypothetical protein AB7U82_12885 [Blastocatellales bacterium]
MFDFPESNERKTREREEKALQDRATSIIKPLIPPDAEERVARAFKQWNQIVRGHIRSETALNLSDGDGRYSIPVQVANGFPKRLAELIDRHHDPALWLLILGQPKISGIVEGAKFLLSNWDKLEQWPQLPEEAKGGDIFLNWTLDTANALQHIARAEKVRSQIKEIDEDILGAYFYPTDQNKRIELYWIPIAMVAAMLDVKIEDLTLVVLAHELAHGYTHLGRDIEGALWDDSTFQETDLEIKEGLAQFYTEVVMEKLAEKTPGPKIAFERLLELQSGPYLVHRDWLEGNSRSKGEAVRFTLVAARKRGVVNYDVWLKMLDDTDVSLGRTDF